MENVIRIDNVIYWNVFLQKEIICEMAWLKMIYLRYQNILKIRRNIICLKLDCSITIRIGCARNDIENKNKS